MQPGAGPDLGVGLRLQACAYLGGEEEEEDARVRVELGDHRLTRLDRRVPVHPHVAGAGRVEAERQKQGQVSQPRRQCPGGKLEYTNVPVPLPCTTGT